MVKNKSMSLSESSSFNPNKLYFFLLKVGKIELENEFEGIEKIKREKLFEDEKLKSSILAKSKNSLYRRLARLISE